MILLESNKKAPIVLRLLDTRTGQEIRKLKIRSSDPRIASVRDGFLVPTGKRHGWVRVYSGEYSMTVRVVRPREVR